MGGDMVGDTVTGLGNGTVAFSYPMYANETPSAKFNFLFDSLNGVCNTPRHFI